jgi:hypothetical protein
VAGRVFSPLMPPSLPNFEFSVHFLLRARLAFAAIRRNCARSARVILPDLTRDISRDILLERFFFAMRLV